RRAAPPRPRRKEPPPVQGPAATGPRPPRQPAHAQRAVRPYSTQSVHPRLKRAVVLLQQLPRKRGPRKSIPLGRPDPAGDDVESQPIPEMRVLRVARVLTAKAHRPAAARARS